MSFRDDLLHCVVQVPSELTKLRPAMENGYFLAVAGEQDAEGGITVCVVGDAPPEILKALLALAIDSIHDGNGGEHPVH